jgi:tripartite-type tricarboxylate transporter receptor subunit TctC
MKMQACGVGRTWHALARAAAMLSIIAAAGLAGPAAAQSDAPLFDSPVHVVVPFTAGGVVDLSARILAKALEPKIHQSVVVDNKPGAGGNIAAVYVARAPASQPTLLVNQANHFVNPVIFKDAGYDPDKDFIPILQLATAPYLFVVNAASKFHNLEDVAAWARQNPGKLSWGYGGVGTAGQFFGVEFARAANIETNPISYKGGPELISAIGGQQIDMIVISAETSLPMIRAGKLRAIAATGDARNTALPDVPTASEEVAGYKPLTGYTILLAAPSIPRDKLVKLQKAVIQIVESPEYKEVLARVGATVTITEGLDATRDFFRKEGARWRDIAKSANLQVN